MKLRVISVIVLLILIFSVVVFGHVYLKNINEEFIFLLDMSVKNVENEASEKYFNEFCRRLDSESFVIGLFVHGAAVKPIYSTVSEVKNLYNEGSESNAILNGLNELIFEINRLYEEHTVNFKSVF